MIETCCNHDCNQGRGSPLRAAVMEASEPDFIYDAIDNVHDMDVSLHDYARAVSRAIRAALGGMI